MKKLFFVIGLVLVIYLVWQLFTSSDGQTDIKFEDKKELSKFTFKINEVNDSGRKGEVEIEQTKPDNFAKIFIKLSGSPKDTPELATLHTGACQDEFTSPLWPLTKVVNGRSETVLEMSPEILLSQKPLALKVFSGLEPSIELVACADIME